MRRQDARDDSEKVEQLIGDYRSGGLAVVGVPDVLAALAKGQVEDVLLSTSLKQFPGTKESRIFRGLRARLPPVRATRRRKPSWPRPGRPGPVQTHPRCRVARRGRRSRRQPALSRRTEEEPGSLAAA